MKHYIPKKGDFVLLTFDPQSGHEQKGRMARHPSAGTDPLLCEQALPGDEARREESILHRRRRAGPYRPSQDTRLKDTLRDGRRHRGRRRQAIRRGRAA